MAKIKYPVIQNDAIIKLAVQASFYKDVSQILMAHVNELGQEEYKKCVEKIKERQPAENLKEATVMILTGLVFSIEFAAQEQKLTTEMEVDVPDDKEDKTTES